ncbi:E3 ubiquitin-protein ligase SP1 isoform X5 [Rhodamnia argentea]|uniref:RING-type E3 ubiquitin transferase n=1 Tax=Rhodamnia argentea TaxID=178133 RepID=A0ABM3HKA9_9MYRT|nr:E3 ubiquitin-protein ligase SP1 isoform X5 [Rhodamnia argentea]
MIPWGGLSCCLSAAALYLLGRSSGRDAEALKCVFRVNQLKELAQLLDKESKVLPLVVTLCGRVGSDTPVNCEYSGLRGVIVEETAEQHFLKHNDAGSWIQDSALMLSMSKEVPWYLDDGTGRVHVVGARGASGFELNIASEVFEESGRSLVRGTLDYLQGLKMLGVKRIERVLPVGSSLTVVGEAVKDDIGTVRIQRPYKGPFYVSPKTIDQLISNLGKWARWYSEGFLQLLLGDQDRILKMKRPRMRQTVPRETVQCQIFVSYALSRSTIPSLSHVGICVAVQHAHRT